METPEKQVELDHRFKNTIQKLEDTTKKVLGPTKLHGYAAIGSGYKWTGVGPKNICASMVPIYEDPGDGDLYYDYDGKMVDRPETIRDFAYQLDYTKGLSEYAIGFGMERSKDILSFKKDSQITRFDRSETSTTLEEEFVAELEQLANDLETLYAFQTHAAEPVFQNTSSKIMAKLRRFLDSSAT